MQTEAYLVKMPNLFISRMLFLAAFLFLISNFISYDFAPIPPPTLPHERFRPELVEDISSVEDLLNVVAELAKKEGVQDTRSIEYAELLEGTVKDRFRHGYSHYNLNENWIAALLGATVWSHLSAVVLPDDLLDYPYAACSQQSIVMIECFKRLGIPVRAVHLQGHFALEGKFNEEWLFFDVNVEADFSKTSRKSIQSLRDADEIFSIYDSAIGNGPWTKEILTTVFSAISYEPEGQLPAGRAMLFHTLTKALSKYFWLLSLLGAWFFFRRSKAASGSSRSTD